MNPIKKKIGLGVLVILVAAGAVFAGTNMKKSSSNVSCPDTPGCVCTE